MTTSESTTVTIRERLDFSSATPQFSSAMNRLDSAATHELDRVGFPAGLRELVRLRASQLNGCAYCVDLHTTAAVVAGENVQRIAAVAVWNESTFFSARERAALAFAESVTLAAQTRVPAADYDAVAEHWSPDEVGALLSLIVTINAWNAIGVATRAWEPLLDPGSPTAG
ncbi:carboxymuconolactone decarboxylase family protein [Terrabacter sp. GCM10028922]|uniref:carboxymuconolactone decarboxylase family protein n=1 Tax=Terrabacter sp. GCM10028922 TaxID=3273428 RepID=UPI003607FBF3